MTRLRGSFNQSTGSLARSGAFAETDMIDRDGQDDEDFPLSDHPGPRTPKAGDREMNRARDLQHLDVAPRNQMPRAPSAVVGHTQPPSAENVTAAIPSNNPVVAAWQGFKTTAGYTSAINSADPGWAMFMAGYAARDSQP